MTNDEALELHDFILQRVFGWTIVIGCNNPRGRMDSRYRSAKVADRLLRESYLAGKRYREFVKAVRGGQDPAKCWPEPFQEFIHFCLWHRVPMELQEPLADHSEDELNHHRVWSEFIRQFDKPGTLADLPMPAGFSVSERNSK